MANHRPTPGQLKRVLDEVHRGIMEAGEWRRSARAAGEEPDWTPCPDADERYADADADSFHLIPTEPERVATEWRYGVMLNHTDWIEPSVGEALGRLSIDRPLESPAWRRFLRLALVVAADAYALEAERERGNYRAGSPSVCSVEVEALAFFAADDLPGAPSARQPLSEPARLDRPTPRRQGTDATAWDQGAVPDVEVGTDRIAAHSRATPNVPTQARLRNNSDSLSRDMIEATEEERRRRRKPGPPSSRNLVIERALYLLQAREQGEADHRFARLTDLGRGLERWLRSTHEDEPQMQCDSIIKALREDAPDVLEALCPIDPTSRHSHGRPSASPATRTA